MPLAVGPSWDGRSDRRVCGGQVLQLDDLPVTGGAVKAHGHRLYSAASLQNGDRLHQARDVLLDEDAPETVAGDRRATAEAHLGSEALPQRRMAVALELATRPEAGLHLEQRHRDPARHQGRGGHPRSPQRAGCIALIGFAVLEVGADGQR
jgi:hypothetical protein